MIGVCTTEIAGVVDAGIMPVKVVAAVSIISNANAVKAIGIGMKSRAAEAVVLDHIKAVQLIVRGTGRVNTMRVP